VNGIPKDAVCFWTEGALWICANGDFKSYEESLVGFGASFEEALTNLTKQNAEVKENEDEQHV
jgi:hypothetical protein